MADSKTTQLTQLAATPATNDMIMMVDVSDTTMSAAGTNKRLPASYVARSDGAAKLIAGDGKELTLPATGTAAMLEAANTFTAAQVIPSLRSSTVSVNDDSAFSIVMPSDARGGVLIVVGGFLMTASGMFFFRVVNSVACAVLASAAGSILAASTGILTGTTGVDGKVTVSPHTDGKVYVENRSGSTFSMTYLVIV